MSHTSCCLPSSAGAEESLAASENDAFRVCNHYASFHGAFVGLITHKDIQVDYIGADMGREHDLAETTAMPHHANTAPMFGGVGLPSTPRTPRRPPPTQPPSYARDGCSSTPVYSPMPRHHGHSQTPHTPITPKHAVAPPPLSPAGIKNSRNVGLFHSGNSPAVTSPGVSIHVSPLVNVCIQGLIDHPISVFFFHTFYFLIQVHLMLLTPVLAHLYLTLAPECCSMMNGSAVMVYPATWPFCSGYICTPITSGHMPLTPWMKYTT